MAFRSLTLATSLSCLAMLAGCGSSDEGSDDFAFSSDQATLLTFEFEGRFIADNVWNAERTAEDQMLYSIGHLNGDTAVGRLDKLELSNIERSELEDGRTLVTYHAKMPVAWAAKTNLPETYDFTFPLHVDSDDYETFTEKYGHSCVDWGAHDVDSGSMWYYYRPNRSGCEMAEEDVFVTTATVTVSDENTEGKYPEYHMVWDDQALTVVAIFGKYEDGATTSSDAGISAYNNFVASIKSKLRDDQLITVPEEVSSNPGVAMPDITFRATRPDGRSVEIVALLVDNVRTASEEFNQRYEELSTDADMIFYNGHAGLGANVRALGQKGEFKAGKYQIFFMNGCDSFAYVDGYLAEARALLNPDDPTGTRYMDMVTNVMPSFFRSMPYASIAMIDGLLSYEHPKTYDEIFTKIDSSEVVVVTGEEDNVYYPGYEPGGGSSWDGMSESGSVASGESTPYELGQLPAGTYIFAMSPDAEQPGGDADLYLALGRAPTLDDYDERPYLNGSAETITIQLDEPTSVFLMVHGYQYADTDSSAYLLEGRAATE